MSAALDLDLATLVGELPAVPCESSGHNAGEHPKHHAGPATHYARVTCEGCGMNVIKSYCAPLTAYALVPNPYHYTECSACGHVDLAMDVITILGPVNGRVS